MDAPPIRSRCRSRLAAAGLLVGLAVPAAWGQADPEPAPPPVVQRLEGRLVERVSLEGLEAVPEALARNSVRLRAGEPYDQAVVDADIRRLTRLGRFRSVQARVEPRPEGGVSLVYAVEEELLIRDIVVAGNKELTDQELLAGVALRAGDPADAFLIERASRQIREAYEREGFFVAGVDVDQAALADRRVLRFVVREGPRVRVRAIEFEGNEVFPDRQLREEVRQPVRFPVLNPGYLNRQTLDLDKARVRQFLRDRGYLDADAGYDIQVSPDQAEAVVSFIVYEGPRYLVEDVRFRLAETPGAASTGAAQGGLLFPDRQLLLAGTLKPGGVYSTTERDRTADAIRDLYGKLGYLDTRVRVEPRFDPEAPRVTLDVAIDEGRPYTVGTVTVRGNDNTQTKVVLRELRGLTPGRPFDRTGLDRSRRRLNESPLFREATVTVLGEPTDQVRDVLVEVTERNTGSITFGANISSDLGLGGAVDITQRNFDIADLPTSLSDLASGRSFRGAGQTFDLTLSPGARNSTYSVNWSDPYFLESDFSFGVGFFLTERDRADFDEQRAGGQVSLGRRFGDVWSARLRARYNQIEIDDIEPDAAVDVFETGGTSDLTSAGVSLVRSTIDSVFAPSRGSRTTLGIDRAGALGGDYHFTRLRANFNKFWTVDVDFLDRKTVLSFRLDTGLILEKDEAPVFERFFAGGRSFRGFDFRGIGPRGIRADTGQLGDDAVGGRWQLLTTLQYEFPLVENYLRGVVFTDQGTITNDPGFDDWRITAGAGVRMQVPFLSQAPFAVDFAVPIRQQDEDEEELVSFTLDIPFR